VAKLSFYVITMSVFCQCCHHIFLVARMAASLSDGSHNDDTISTQFKQAFLKSCYANFSGADQEVVSKCWQIFS